MYPTYPTAEPPPELPTVDLSSYAPRPRPRRDPLAVALANASLVGIGYLLLGRRWLMAVNAVISIVLVITLGTAEQAGWLQILLFVWWAAVILHGFLLASRTKGPTPDVVRHRIMAAVVAVAVVGTFVVFRLDVNGEANDADAAHQEGDCGLVQSIVDGVGFWQRVGDAPIADGMLDSAEACRLIERARGQAKDDREAAANTIATYEELPAAQWKGARQYRGDLLLDQADAELEGGLRRDTDALGEAFRLLTEVRTDFPERRADVDSRLDDFLDTVADPNQGTACAKVDITDWIKGQETRTKELDRAGEIVPKVAPAAIVNCADFLLANGNASAARTRYQQLNTEYGSDPLVPRAQRGVTLATYAIQLNNVRSRLHAAPNEQPAYCRNPVPYSAAKPWRGRGPHRALVFGQDYQRNSLPSSARATDAANATLIICVGADSFGDVVETCEYTDTLSPGAYTPVSFRKRKHPVRVYEVRTGRRIADTAIQISGASCPFSFYGTTDDRYVEPSTSDIRAAYQRWISP